MIFTSIIISTLALFFSFWMGRQNPVRSSGLTAGMLVLLMLSPLLILLPKVPIDLPWVVASSGEISELTKITSANIIGNHNWNISSILIGVYGLGCVLLITRLIGHFMKVRHWCNDSVTDQSEAHKKLLEKCAEQLELSKLPRISYSEHVTSPVVTGLLHPVLLIPKSSASWTLETLEIVMLHELGHLKRNDLWISLASQLACAIHWFNPLVWILRKRLIYECEYACDAHVISSGVHPGDYINALCDVAESCQKYSMINSRNGQVFAFSASLSMAQKASLKHRVKNLLHKNTGAPKTNSLLVIIVLVVSAGTALAINMVRPDERLREMEAYRRVEIKVEEFPTQDEVDLRLSADPFPAN